MLNHRVWGAARLWGRFFMFCVVVVTGASGAVAAEGRDIQQYTLDNGLTVVLAPMPGLQRVAVVVRYNVGSADEQKGRSGFAHLFEHLMFEGTAAVPDFDAETTKFGADQNAFTDWDATTYYIAGSAQFLPKFLRLDADRMANLANAVTQEDLDNQRAVIRNELRQQTLDEPGMAAQQQSEVEVVDKDHPYGHSTIGSLPDLDAATLDDVRAFHRMYYVPSNAILTIAGGFDVAKTREDVARTFGLVPAAPRPAPVTGTVSPRDTVRLDATDAVEQPLVSFGWLGPAAGSEDDAALAVLDGALSSDSGPLYVDLVEKQHVATAVWTAWDSRRLGGLFTLNAKAAPGVSATALEQALKASWSRVVAQGLGTEQLHAASQSLAAGFNQAEAEPTYYAFGLETAAAEMGSAAQYRHVLDVAAALTPAATPKLLAPFARPPGVISTVSPGARNTVLPPVITQSTGNATGLPFTPRPEVMIPDLAAGDAGRAEVPTGETVTLRNGIPVTVFPTRDAKNSAITLILPVGSTATSGSQQGLIDLTLKLDMHGAGTMTREAFSRALEKSGAALYRTLTLHGAAITLTSPTDTLDAATDLLAAAVRTPRFTAEDWALTVAQSTQRIAEWKSSPDVVASIAAASVIYPAGSPEGAEKTVDGVGALKMDDAVALHRALFAPGTFRMEVVSSLSPAQVKALLDTRFGEWSPEAKPVAAPAPALPSFPPQEITRDVKGATQAALLVSLAAPEGLTREAVAFEIAMQVLAGSSNNRLNKVIREEKGWSYGVSGGVGPGEKGLANGSAYIFATVEADHVRDALQEMRRLRGELTVRPVTEAEFEGARQEIRKAFQSAMDTTLNLANNLTGLAVRGYAPEDLTAKMALYDSVTLEEVQQQAKAIAVAPVLTVIAGDLAKIH